MWNSISFQTRLNSSYLEFSSPMAGFNSLELNSFRYKMNSLVCLNWTKTNSKHLKLPCDEILHCLHFGSSGTWAICGETSGGNFKPLNSF